MEDKDFQVGDKVMFFSNTGQLKGVVKANNNGGDYRITVAFKNILQVFTSCGRHHKNREAVLFHGHNLKITGEEIPKRTRWVSVPDDMVGASYYNTLTGIYRNIEFPIDLADQFEAWIKNKSKK